MIVCHMLVLCTWGLEEGIGSPETGVTEDYESSCGYKELNASALKELIGSLNTKSSLKP